jgi:hypothetical protein
MSCRPPVMPPQHLQTITLSGATVLLNLQTGQADTLIGPAHTIWQARPQGMGISRSPERSTWMTR